MTGTRYEADPPGPWDKNHDGHSGWEANDIRDATDDGDGFPGPGWTGGSIADWVAAENPDVVLILLGANDVKEGVDLGEEMSSYNQGTVDEIHDVVDIIQAQNPSVRIFVA